MKHLGKWLLLLNKRLYKKLTFLLILALIPALVLGYGLVAQEESGVMTIALTQEGNDPLAETVMQDLKENTNLIRFVFCDSPESARKMVSDSKADAAWIFAADMEAKVYKFVQNPVKENSFVRVVEQGSSIPLKLAREKLSGTIFGYCSATMYLTYIRNNVPQLDEMSDETLMEYYNNFDHNIDLFQFTYLEGLSGTEDAKNANYLLTPIRGMLAIIVVLGALAAAMYYIRDEQAGTFALVPQRRKASVEFSCQMIAVVNISAVVLIAMLLAGLAGNIGRELLILALYAISTALFGMTVRRLCGNLATVGTALPLLVVVMLVICPVFFDLGVLRALQYLFPPTYYINAVSSNRFLLLMVVYSGVLLAVYTLSGKLLRRK